MAAKKTTKPRSTKSPLSAEEREAMRETLAERRAAAKASPSEMAAAVLAKIDTMPEPDRSLGRRLHQIILATAPQLNPRLWYGMPAYSNEGDTICWFQPASKFRARYGMLGFSDKAKLDDGKMWPTAFAITTLTKADEARIKALVKQAVG